MKQFVSPNPNAEVLGHYISGYLRGLGDEVLPLAAQKGFGNLQLDSWYSYQQFLDLLKDLATPDMQGTFDLIKVGMKTGNDGLARYKPSSIEDFFVKVREYARDSFRGLDTNIWWQHVSYPNRVIVYSSNFTGCDHSYGVLYTVVRALRPAHKQFSVKHSEGACRKKGDDYCVFDVRWWDEDEEVDKDQM